MSILVRYANFYVKNLRKNNDKMTQFHWSRKSRDSCPTSSAQRNNLHRELASDKTRITKSLASAMPVLDGEAVTPPENFKMAGIFFLKGIQQMASCYQGRREGGVPGVTTSGPGPKGGPG